MAEICVHSINTLILLALRSDKEHSQEIFIEIEFLLKVYLKNDIGDEIINNNSIELWDKLAKLHQLNARQSLILKYAFAHQELTIQNCEAMFPDISRRTLQRDVQAMLEQKLLLPQGNTDRRCYRFDRELLSL